MPTMTPFWPARVVPGWGSAYATATSSGPLAILSVCVTAFDVGSTNDRLSSPSDVTNSSVRVLFQASPLGCLPTGMVALSLRADRSMTARSFDPESAAYSVLPSGFAARAVGATPVAMVATSDLAPTSTTDTALASLSET